jgi:hypothetical protein
VTEKKEKKVDANGDDEDDNDDDEEVKDAEKHRLLRTSPLIDWFNVKALEMTGMDTTIEADV